MKNYFFNGKLSEIYDFIKYYYVKGDKIIAVRPFGKKTIYDKTTENEIMILEKMKQQVINSYKFLDKYEIEYKTETHSLRINSASLLIFSIIFGAFNFAENLGVIPNIIIGFSLGRTIHSFALKVFYQIKINDIKKNQLFLDNMELLSDAGNDNSHDRILSNVSKKTRQIFLSGNLTLNDVEKISYRDMKQLVSNANNIKTRVLKIEKEKEQVALGVTGNE